MVAWSEAVNEKDLQTEKNNRASMGLAFKLSLLVLAGVGLIFAAVFVYNYQVSRRIITRNLETSARNLAMATVNRIDAVLRAAEQVPAGLAVMLENSRMNERAMMNVLHRLVENNPEISGATIALEPFVRGPADERFALYFYRNGSEVDFTRLDYDYFFHDWYQIPKELARAVWSEPYYGAGACGGLMSTYSVPFYRVTGGKRILAGIVAADVSLTWLQKTVASIKIAETGYAFLISKNGTFLTHPDQSLIMNDTIFSVAAAGNSRRLRQLGRQMTRGRSGYCQFRSIHTGKQCWLVYEPLPSNGWSLGVLFPQQELMADIKSLNRTVLILGLGGFLVLLVVIILIARSITGPVRALSETAEQIARGNLDARLPVIASRDEVGRLAESFRHMQEALKKYIRDLAETIASKERIESELKIAHDIQMGILPKDFPPFPDRREIDIYATLRPARQVGGDFYDFFFVDRDHLWLAVGDVSGKGVPAALFMSMTKTLVKAKSSRGLAPHKVLARVQEDLALNNPSMMFVTLFLAVLDLRTGDLEYCNAGHNPPCIIRADGKIYGLESGRGMALAVVDDFRYRSATVKLARGEAVFLYTDGVTEAMNGAGELFGQRRLEQALCRLAPGAGLELADRIMAGLEDFSRDVDQSDDITMLHLVYHGPVCRTFP